MVILTANITEQFPLVVNRMSNGMPKIVEEMFSDIILVGKPDVTSTRLTTQEALIYCDNVLTQTAHEMMNQWGLNPSTLAPASQMKVINLRDAELGAVLRMTPAYLSHQDRKAKFVTENFLNYVINLYKIWDMNDMPIGPVLYGLALMYAEESVVHGRCVFNDNSSLQSAEVFRETFVRLYQTNKLHPIYDPYPYPKKKEYFDKTQIAFSGVHPHVRYESHHFLLKDAEVLDEMIIKSLTFEYMQRLCKNLGLRIPEEKLMPTHIDSCHLEGQQVGKFKAVRDFMSRTGQDIVPTYVDSVLLERTIEFVGTKEEKLNFASDIFLGNVTQAVGTIAKVL